MKRLTALLLVLAMLLAFAGCESTADSKQEQKQNVESTEDTGAARQQGQDEPAEQVSLAEALLNTLTDIEDSGNLTLTLNVNIDATTEQYPGFSSGMNMVIGGNIQLIVDNEAEDVTAYGTVNASGLMMNVAIYDGWGVYYDTTLEQYCKEDISEDIAMLFENSEQSIEDLEDLLDMIPKEELEAIEEILDMDMVQELFKSLVTEKFADQQWVEDTFGYSSVTEGDTVIHTFELDLVTLLQAILGHFEEAFLDEDDYFDLMDSIDELEETLPEFTLALKLFQVGDRVTGLGLDLSFVDSATDQTVKADATVTFSEIGTTEIDTDMLEKVIDEVKEIDELYEDYYEDSYSDGDLTASELL